MRNWADYHFDKPLDEAAAIERVGIAMNIIQLLHHLGNEPAILARVINGVKAYELDVLHEVTWHP
jgi:hypothetical protein